MSGGEAVGVVQFGATGPVADRFRTFVAQSEIFRLEAIATATQPELHGKKLGETYIEHPSSLEDVPIMGIVSARDNTDSVMAFSSLQTKMAKRYERSIAKAGKVLFSNSAANRMESDVALVSSFVNPHHIDELFRTGVEDKMITGGNCLVDIELPAVAAVHRGIGIQSMSVKTEQGWSGAGAHEVPEGVGNSTQPIGGDEHKKIQTEPNKFLGAHINDPEGILIGADPKDIRRASWLDGHKAEITMILERATSRQEIEELLKGFEAPEELNAVRPLLRAISRAGGDKKWPRRHEPIRPIKLEHGDLVRTDVTPHRLDRLQPMRSRAHIVHFDPEDPTRIVIEVSGHNLWLGAVGGNMLNAAYAWAMGYLS